MGAWRRPGRLDRLAPLPQVERKYLKQIPVIAAVFVGIGVVTWLITKSLEWALGVVLAVWIVLYHKSKGNI
jgi:hypothetical protein